VNTSGGRQKSRFITNTYVTIGRTRDQAAHHWYTLICYVPYFYEI